MATRRPIRDTLWQLAGFANPAAFDVAMTGLGRAGLLRPSKHGTSANQLNNRELAVIVLALRGKIDAEETKALTLLRADLPGTAFATLAELVEHLVAAGAANVLSGKSPAAVSITLGFGPGLWATVDCGNGAERFSAPALEEIRSGIRKTITITPEIFEKMCEFAADSTSRAKTKSVPSDHQGNVPGEATKRNARQAANLTGVGCLSSKTQSGETQRQPSTTDDSGKRLVGITSRRATGDPVRNHIERVPHGQKTKVACCRE